MKILLIIPTLSKGGAERLTVNIASELSKNRQNDVRLVTFHKKNEYAFLSENLEHTVIPSSVQLSISGKNKADVSDLQNFITEFQPDVIHTHLFETEVVLSAIQIPKHTKRVVHFHDNMVQFTKTSSKSFFSKERLTNLFERKTVLNSYPSNTTFIGISKDAFQFMKANLPKKFAPTLLHNAIDLNRFQPGSAEKNNSIVTIGSLVDKKGQALAIEAMEYLNHRENNYELHVLGDGPLRGQLEELSKKLKTDKNVFFHGNVDNPEVYLKKAKLYLHTAKYEPFGLVLIEAMACGLPVVSTDGIGNRDLIEYGENGFLIENRDLDRIVEKIDFLMKSNDKRQEMGGKALCFAEKFGIIEYCEKLLVVYEN